MAANMFAGGNQGFYNNQATQTNQFPINVGLNPYQPNNFSPNPNPLKPNFSPAPVNTNFTTTNAIAASPIAQKAATQPQGFLSSVGSFLGNNAGDLMRSGGEYYLGQQNIEGAQRLGRETQAGALALAEEAKAGTEFKPYTVTSDLANVVTTPEGGFDINLSPDQLALQTQLQGQAGGLFGQVGVDPALAQAQLYEQMRAVQRPEEERQRLALEERMLSQGRLGLGSAAYGGSSPELLAQETARQEAMARANLGARQQSMAEQQQAASLGGLLQQAGYQPQQQALSMLSGSQFPAGFADVARRTGTELATQMGLGGLEARLQAEDLANRLQLQQQQGLMGSVFGEQPTIQEQLMNRILNPNGPALTGSDGLFESLSSSLGFGDAPTPDIIKAINPLNLFKPKPQPTLSGAEREQAMADFFN